MDGLLRLSASSLAQSLPRLHWPGLSLVRKFVILCTVVVSAGMLIIGGWVAQQIEEGVTQNAATTAALYVDSIVSPLTQELQTSDRLTTASVAALDTAIAERPVSKGLLAVKIWKADGTIVYSDDHRLIGKKFNTTAELLHAANGNVVAGFDDLDDEEDAKERETGLPILEIYSPIREPFSGNVIAIAEFYENGTALKNTLANAQLQSWLIVAAVMAGIAGSLMTIVYSASDTIDGQRVDLQARLVEVIETSDQNRRLRNRVQRASEKLSELNERYLKSVSAELHDGPAQLVGFASLRLNGIMRKKMSKEQIEEVGTIKKALDDAMQDIRNLCRGLALPEVAGLSLQEIIELVTNTHAERTDTLVHTEVPKTLIPASHSLKICTYRFVQEALNNAWQHANAADQSVVCSFDVQTDILIITVSDSGKGIVDQNGAIEERGLGLSGLRERIKSIGGVLSIESDPTSGTKLTMQVNLREMMS